MIPRCACARNADGTTTTMLCPVHALQDPCLTMSQVTGRRRTGTIRSGVCTSCGHGTLPPTLTVESIHKLPHVVAPIIVHVSHTNAYTDLEVADKVLLATGETRERLTQISITRQNDEDRAVVYLYRD